MFKIGAKASFTKIAGSYTNTINFIITPKVLTTNYIVTYIANDGYGGANTTNMPDPSVATGSIMEDIDLLLSPNIPEMTGYDFLGWCDENNANDISICDGITYQPGDIISIANIGGTINKMFYGIWEREELIKYVVSNSAGSDRCSNFTGDGEYTEGDSVQINCAYYPNDPCPPFIPFHDLYMNGVSVTNLASCKSTGAGPFMENTCTYSFTMPAQNVEFSTCGN